MSSSEALARAVVIEQAAEWFVLHRSNDLDAAGRTSFESWLTTSPLHIEEYLGIARLAQDLPAAGADPAFAPGWRRERARAVDEIRVTELTVSYTHLTLPTIYSV